MSKEIWIGAFVGLVTTSTIYVWNSENFTKTQKLLLLACVACFPLQWLGIIACLLYNKHKENNTEEKIAERKIEQKTNLLNFQIENLKDLNEKGILNDEEYNQKAAKIEQEKTEENLKNSQEYKQLKSLFENGILTKEEFGNKIDFIKKNKSFITTNDAIDDKFNKIVYNEETEDGKVLKIVSKLNETIGAKVFIDDRVADDGIYIYKSFFIKLIVKNGIIVERFYLEKYKDFIYEKAKNRDLSFGDKIYNLNWEKVPDGKYRYSFWWSCIVENGVVIKI